MSGPPVGVLPPGPVWHVSVAGSRIRAVLEAEALRQLTGVGDPQRGEWRTWTGTAFHVRRRLTAAEERKTGPVADVRGTDEARDRAAVLGGLLRLMPPEVLAEELGTGD